MSLFRGWNRLTFRTEFPGSSGVGLPWELEMFLCMFETRFQLEVEAIALWGGWVVENKMKKESALYRGGHSYMLSNLGLGVILCLACIATLPHALDT